MRFIHLADMHFDNSFKVLAMKKDLGDKRRLEQRAIFKRVIEYIKKEKIEYLFIAGDLYEDKYIKESTIEYINNLFKEISETKIFITPGNHDPLLKNSFYAKYKWAENVYIFNSNIRCYEFDNVDIYGFGFEDFYCEYSGLENITIKNKDKLNILVTHGALNASNSLDLKYNPISKNMLEKIGFDYIALGHVHKGNYMDNKKIVYPGSVVSGGFDELGEHGILDVNLEKYNTNIKFVRLDNRVFEEKQIDISNLNSEEEIIELINSTVFNNEYMYKIQLVGDKKNEFDIGNIKKLITVDNVLKLEDLSKMPYDIKKLSEQNNLTGYFVRECLSKIESGEVTETEAKKAIEIGLGVL